MTVQYLIDSENVGDFWIPLLELPAEETELIVFYTRNSPHMSYDSLIRLKESNRAVTFIKCYEGTNALDFQLVSELGYRICENEDGRFVIVTNDTGFDAAVKYWRRRKKSVKRITGKEAKNLERRIREDLSAGHSEERRNASAVPERRYTAVEHDAEHDAHVDAWHAEKAQDPDGRPSRTNLRDAESAARDDQEELQSAVSVYAAEEDYETDDYEPEDEALNEVTDSEVFSADEDADDDTDDPAAAEEMDEEAAEDAFADADFEAQDFQEESDSEDPESGLPADIESAVTVEMEPAADAEQQAARQEQIVQAYADVWSAEDNAAAEGLTAKDISSAEDTADGEDYFVNAESEQLVLFAPDGSDQDPEADDVNVSEAAEDGAQTDAAEEDADTDTAASENPEGAENSGEDAAPEAQHRSKSRRSRSRRSRSSSRKQNAEADAPAGDGRGKAGEEDAKSEKQNADKAADNEESKAQPEAGQPAFIALTPVDPSSAPSDEEIARIAACIGADNLAELHNQLATFYGDQGKEIYLSIRNNTRSLPDLKPDLKQKFSYYCEIIFARSDSAGEYPSDISEFLLSVREKLNNLNSLRYALQKHYGKEKGRRFYFLLKPFAKTMCQM